MKKYILFCIPLLLVNCSKPQREETVPDKNLRTENELKPPAFQRADTTKVKNYIAVFDNETENETVLSNQELRIVNLNLEDAVQEFNKGLYKRIKIWNNKHKNDFRDFEQEKINLRYYFRQYFVSTNEKSEKIVRIFCLCSCSGDEWRNGSFSVCDGGDCFLNLEVNITKNSHNGLSTNGYA